MGSTRTGANQRPPGLSFRLTLYHLSYRRFVNFGSNSGVYKVLGNYKSLYKKGWAYGPSFLNI